MPCQYQNIYPVPPELAGSAAKDSLQVVRAYEVGVGAGTIFSGAPRLAYTRVSDAELLESGLIEEEMNQDDFAGSISIGSQCYIESGHLPAFHNSPVKLTTVQINNGDAGRIKIGNRVVLQGVAILAYQSVEIGDDVLFGPMVTIMDSSGHPLLGRGQSGEAARIRSSPVRIENGAWIGMGAPILKGVRIGEGAVIGAHAVVSENIPPYCVAVGNPARVVKHLEHGKFNANAELKEMLAVY